MVDCSVQQSSIAGVYQFGVGGLEVRGSSLDQNTIGIHMTGGGALTGFCSDLNQNTTAGIFLEEGSELDLSAVAAEYPQWDVSDNFRSVELDRAGLIRMVNGFNNFTPSSGSGLPRAINGTQDIPGLNPFSPFYFIYADRNQWNSANSVPISGTDYSVNAQTGATGIVIDPTPDYVPCGQEPCPTCPPDEMPDSNDPLDDCNGCENVQLLTNFTAGAGEEVLVSVPMNVAISDAIRLMSSYDPESGNDLEASGRLLQILTYSYQSIDSIEAYLISLAHSRLGQSLNAIQAEALENPSPIADSLRLAGLD
ncbi:MAG: hypothetical protein AAF206_28425 [Bacteroidota bacterium]